MNPFNHRATPNMKIISSSFVCVAALLLLGCSSSRCCSKCSPSASGQRYSYDPVKDMTTIEKDGFTWYLKGNVTNLVLTPKAAQ